MRFPGPNSKRLESSHLASIHRPRAATQRLQMGEDAMLTIEEAKIWRPTTFRHVPRGATLEYSQENFLRPLEEEDPAASQTRASFLVRQIDRVVCAVSALIKNFSGALQPIIATDQRRHG